MITKWAKLSNEIKKKGYLNVWNDGVCRGHFDLNAFYFTHYLSLLMFWEVKVLKVEVLLLVYLNEVLSVHVTSPSFNKKKK